MASSIAFDVIARDKASATFSKIGRSAQSTESRLAKFGRATAGLVGLTSLTTAAVGFIKVGAEYSSSLNKIQALTGASDARMKAAASTLQANSGAYAKLGQTTGDAAGGVVELTKAGLSLSDSLKAVNSTMVLAKAGELSVADASSLVANTLNTFSLKANKAGDIANYLANAANISSADVSDLAESFKYVAPVAAATGVSLKQTNAILAELSNSGIAASNAGTGFRKFLLSLQAPSGAAAKDLKGLGVEIFNARGKMKPLGTVIDTLNQKMSKLTDKDRQKVLKDVFGLQGLSSAQVILKNGSKGLAEYTKGVGKAGAAQKLAESASKGFMGTLKMLRAEVISSAQAAYRNLEPSLTAAAKSLTKFLEQMRSGKGAGGDFASVLKDLGGIVKGVVGFLNGLPGPVKKFGIEGLIAYGVITKLSSGFSSLGAGLVTPIAKIKQFSAEMTYPATRMAAIKTAAYQLGGALRNLAGVGGLLLVTKSMSEADDSARTFERTLGGAMAGFAVGGPIGAAIGTIAGFASSVVSSGKRSAHGFDIAKTAAKEYADTLGVLTGKMTKNTQATVVQSLTKDSDSAVRAAGALGISVNVLARDLMGNAKAHGKVNEKLREGILSGKMMTYANGGQARAADVLAQALKGTIHETADGTAKTKGLIQSYREARTEAAANAKKGRELAAALKGIPTKVATQIVQPGGKQSLSDIEKLVDKYKRTPQQVRTLIKALGIDVTDAQLKTLIDHSKTLDQIDPKVSVSADTSKARGQLSTFSSYLNEITHPRVVTVSVKHVGASGGIGGLLGQTTGKSGGRFAGSGRGSDLGGGRFMSDSMKAAATQTMSIKKALAKFGGALSKATDSLSSLKDLKQTFLDTFQADNPFGADFSNGGTAQTLVDFEAKQAAQAQQLLADIQNLASRGLSKSLISQLQAQGTSGALQLHALASGSNAQISQFNAYDAQTQSSLQAAGMFAGNTVRGGNIDTDIKAAAREEALLNRLVDKLDELMHQKFEGVVINMDSETVVRGIKKRNKRKGVSTAGL
jgi:TP901 family phage tail tape measure protein